MPGTGTKSLVSLRPAMIPPGRLLLAPTPPPPPPLPMPTPLPPAPLLQTNPLERQLPTRPASFTAPSAFTAPGAFTAPSAAPDAGSMADKVRQIRAELLIDPSLSMAATIAEANEQMGLVAQGPLLSQVEQLLAVLGLNR